MLIINSDHLHLHKYIFIERDVYSVYGTWVVCKIQDDPFLVGEAVYTGSVHWGLTSSRDLISLSVLKLFIYKCNTNAALLLWDDM